ncbi:MAG TPA: galactose oxidase-like domain-containing protein, partial [Steroidobacteraceae bacterium]|nr:galactose oxidase-like domain-containing protein [Steroidobacteraceae bacterium]
SCTNFTQIGTPTGTTFNNSGLTAGTSYRYRVRATDAAANLSAYSNIIAVTTTGGGGSDTTPPTVSFSAPAAGATLTGNVTLAAVVSDSQSAVGGVQYQVDGANVGVSVGSPYSTTLSTAQFANGAHTLGVYAWDTARNISSAVTMSVTFSNASPGNPAQTGLWSGLFNWPIVAVHTNLMNTGRILAWDGQEFGHNGRVFDPRTGVFTDATVGDNLFCSGHVELADGRILVVGGHISAHTGIPDANIFNPATETWTSVASMQFPRWYPTATRLPDGRVLVNSGETNCDRCFVTTPEIYNPATNTWSQLTGAQQSLPYYPHLYVLPDGRLLATSTSENPIASRVLNLATQTWSMVDPSNTFDGGSSAMYLPGKFLKAGTSANPDSPPPSSARTAYVLDMTQQVPAWRAVASMQFPRTYGTLSLLPDGNVLMTGGGRTTNATDVANAVLEAELWSPTTETWTTLAAMHAPRLYHSNALLLPDGRLLIVGGGRFNSGTDVTDQLNGEYFSPPYLFKGPRPVITAAPTQLSFNQPFTVTSPDASRIAKVVLIADPDVTHTINVNQRYLPLTFTASSGSLSVTAPVDANLAPPGFYMLFLVDTNGVPSVAVFIKL